jgi:hypothetical protein
MVGKAAMLSKKSKHATLDHAIAIASWLHGLSGVHVQWRATVD